MPSKSKSQQRFMGMVRAAQKGGKPASAKVAKVANRINPNDAEDFAGAYPEHMRKKFDKKRQKQSEVLGYKLMGTPDVKTEIDDATIKEEKLIRRLCSLCYIIFFYELNKFSLIYNRINRIVRQVFIPKIR